MTQQGFEDYVFAVYGKKNGTASSYVTAIRIIDELFAANDVFSLNGASLTCIEDTELLKRIADFICEQQSLYIKGQQSFFSNVNLGQSSYPGKRFCSAAIKQLLHYHSYDNEEKKAWDIFKDTKKGKNVSKELITLLKIDKEGNDKTVETRVRLGQSYFRKMVLANYDNKCCVTGLNIPQTLIASHIVAWAADKGNRMNPENGLCLSATYDAAFDRHLISFDNDYRMVLSKRIREYCTNEVANTYFLKLEGKQITLPKFYLPNKKLLEKHRELLVG